MATETRHNIWPRIRRLQRMRRVRNIATWGLVVLGPLLALATFLIFGPLDLGASAISLRLIMLADLVYVLVVAGLILSQVGRVVVARRARSAGSRLHLRLTAAFAIMALLPAITVAIFAVLTLNIGLETWFSSRVQAVVGASLEASEAYEAEQRSSLSEDTNALARYLGELRLRGVDIDSVALADAQLQVQRGLREAFIIDGAAKILTRGDRSYLFDFEAPLPRHINEARDTGLSIIKDWPNNEFRALAPVPGTMDQFLYVSRDVDGKILALLDETQETARYYQQQETERGRRLFDFALLYLGFALLLVLAATWAGLWFAERLSRPVGRLTGAAQRVGAGDLDVQVPDEAGDDEIAMLGRYFNQMTHQLKGQRETLLDNTRQIERRRRLFDSVLSSVTSGVVGLDAEGRVTFVNRSAEKLLGWTDDHQSFALAVAVPEFASLFALLKAGESEVLQTEVKVTRQGRAETLLVRMATRRSEQGRLEGYVVAFDDVTDLVSAQRMAAWGDVARRIAHEIKNPLTPIQLSAERIKRKFSPRLGEDSEQLDNMTDTIVRQTEGLRRIVDEFSRFARMPEPERRMQDMAQIVRDAVTLQRAGQPDVTITSDMPDGEVLAEIDDTMMSQALTNLIKNAGEAIDTLKEKGAPDGHEPEIRVALKKAGKGLEITIADNGIGLPEDRARLFEPYVTSRDEGTGLGLPIVKKIIEEHGGTLVLENAPAFTKSGHFGAMAVIALPQTRTGTEKVKEEP